MLPTIQDPGMCFSLLAQAGPPNTKSGFIFALLPVTGLLILCLLVPFLMFRRLGRRAMQMGYPSRRTYLQAVPRNDVEKRDAVDLTLKGAILCILGVLFPPMILFGVVPLYYGGRKLAMIGVGLKPSDTDGPRSSQA